MSFWLYQGDCVEVMKGFPSESIDAVVTDPPAGIGFMGKEWDDFRRTRNPNDAGRDSIFGRLSQKGPEYARTDRDAFIEFICAAMTECFRLLKPGGHALVWAIPKTSHWTAMGVELAGFEIRDVVMHLFGSGYPKGLRLGGGWGTCLKPAAEHWILARKPPIGNVASNIAVHGVGGLNIGANEVNGRWPANVVLDEEAGALLGETSRFFYCAKTSRTERDFGCEQLPLKTPGEATSREDGSAGISSPSAGAGRTGEGVRNAHPTLKSVSLMRWLTKLVTPPGGTVLDCFAGAGSTGMACLLEGFNFVGIEKEEEYLTYAQARISAVERGEWADK